MHRKGLGLVLLASRAHRLRRRGAAVAPEVRAATFRFAPEVTDKERAMGARRDRQGPPGGAPADRRRRRHGHDQDVRDRNDIAVGLMTTEQPGAYYVSFNLAYLNADRKIDRDATVAARARARDRPRAGPAGAARPARRLAAADRVLPQPSTPATAPRPRSASPTRSPSGRCAAPCPPSAPATASRRPASLEDWGAPLATLAIKIDVAAKRLRRVAYLTPPGSAAHRDPLADSYRLLPCRARPSPCSVPARQPVAEPAAAARACRAGCASP